MSPSKELLTSKSFNFDWAKEQNWKPQPVVADRDPYPPYKDSFMGEIRLDIRVKVAEPASALTKYRF